MDNKACNKVCLSNAELELTQRIQMHFPRGVIAAEILSFWNGCSKETLTTAILEKFGKVPDLFAQTERKVDNIFPISVNYSQSVADAIKAGDYDWADNGITQKHFPTKCSGIAEVDIELVHFNKDMSTDEVLAELDKKGLRPAELHELLALGEKFPDLQREFPIIGLGSVWRGWSGRRFCPCLRRVGSRRSLDLSWIVIRWRGGCRFAAVRK